MVRQIKSRLLQLMVLRFVTSESAFDYFRATRAYLETHGKPVAIDRWHAAEAVQQPRAFQLREQRERFIVRQWSGGERGVLQ